VAYVVLRNRNSITELAPSCTARSSLIMSAKRLQDAYERMPVNVNSDSEEVSASRQQPTPSPVIGASYPNYSLQDAPLTKKRGRPPTDPQERAKWEQHQKAVEKARLAAEAKPTAGLQRRQNQPNPVQGAGQRFIEKRYKQMTFLQPKLHPAPLGVCSLTCFTNSCPIFATNPHVFCRSLLVHVTCWPRWARATLLSTTSRSA
jgi:hypothetical protein